MNNEMIVRAWKDPEYRATLSAEDRARLPASPSGLSLSELNDAEWGAQRNAPTCSICYDRMMVPTPLCLTVEL